MVDIRPLRLGEEMKKEEERRKKQDENIMVYPIPKGDHNKQLVVVYDCNWLNSSEMDIRFRTCNSRGAIILLHDAMIARYMLWPYVRLSVASRCSINTAKVNHQAKNAAGKP